ncbi:MAG: tetratricopeptide repeat protein [Flavobacteriales bacterium]|nr:tetratricopeptide repeat protein [Flavobacteriales bacterium]
MIIRFCLLLLMGLLFSAGVSAQEPVYLYTGEKLYRDAQELFDHEKYVPAKEKFEQYLLVNTDVQSEFRVNAEFYRGLCALYLFHKDAEFLLERFAHDHPDSPHVRRVYFELATFTYKKRDYRRALEWFGHVDPSDLSEKQKIEFYYKRGHTRFVLEDFTGARSDFAEVKDIPGDYRYPALYYYSHIAYETGDYQVALEGFSQLQQVPDFKPVVPYYIAQIYYKQGKYDQVIAYAPAVLDSASVNNTKRIPEIARLIGDSYYRREQFADAIPFLEKYHANTDKSEISREDYYQLGYVYYRVNQYLKALEAFSECTREADELHQMASYNMGDCYLRLDQKPYARNAFEEASEMDFNREVKEDAMFNYAKLAFELSFNPFHEAITAFEQYLEAYPDSPRRDEAYEFLLNVYMKSRAYDKALASLDKIKNKDPRVKEAYQVVTYNRGVELFQSDDWTNALKYFDKVSVYPVNPVLNAEALFWKAEIAYQQKKWDDAKGLYAAFLTEPGAFSSPLYGLGNYGYGYTRFKKGLAAHGELKKNLFNEANTYFRKFSDATGPKDPKKLNDAYLRIGDCYYVAKNYPQAIVYYDKSADLNQGQRDYAMFQKAMCYGYDGQPDKQAWVLKSLLSEMPDSRFEADAKFELARTYLSQDRLSEAKSYYDDILKNHPGTQYVKYSLVDMCLIYVKQGNVAKVKETWNRLKQDYPNDKVLKDAYATVKDTLIDDPDFINDAESIEILDVQALDLENDVFNSAKSYALDGNCEIAIPKLKEYLSKYSPALNGVEANYYLGNCYFDKSEFDKALSSYNFVISRPLSDFTEECLVSAATILYNQKNYTQALDYYAQLEQVAVLGNNRLEGQIGVMRCSYHLGDKATAKAYADKVISNANTPENIRITAQLWRGRISMDNGVYDQARNDFKEVIKKGGVMAAEAKYNLALIEYKLEQFKKTEEEVFELIDKYSNFNEWKYKGFLLLSDAYIGMEDYFQARATLNAIIENVTEQWVIDEAEARLAMLDAMENPNTAPPDGEGDGLEINFNNGGN